MRLEVAPQALADVKEIARYIARDKPGTASAWAQRIQAEFSVVQRSPLIFPLVEIHNAGLRKARVGAYLIFFRTQGDMVRIERVLHGMRDLPRHLP